MILKIKTKDLIVRPFTLSDVKRACLLSREEGQAEWMPDQVYKDEKEGTLALEFLISKYKNNPKPDKEPFVLAVDLNKTGELIGHVGLSPYQNAVEIGYAVAESQFGKGFATQAVTAVSKWALSNLDIKFIYGIVACENKGSSRVLEKSGYQLEEESNRKYHGKMRLCRKYLLLNNA